MLCRMGRAGSLSYLPKTLKYQFQTYAVWNNMRFMYNNGTQTKYPSDITGVLTQYCNHRGIIDYVKSGNIESTKIY